MAELEKQLEKQPFAPTHSLADAERSAASQSSALEQEVCALEQVPYLFQF